MAQTDAEYQCAWRERHWGKPRGNRVLLARLTALRACVSSVRPNWQPGRRPVPGRRQDGWGGVSGGEGGAR